MQVRVLPPLLAWLNRDPSPKRVSASLTIVVAIDQVLDFERRVWRLTRGAELARARARFAVPDAEALRDELPTRSRMPSAKPRPGPV